MANIKSQIKRNRQNDKRRLRNRVYRGTARIEVKNVRTAMEEAVPESKAALNRAISALDKAVEQGVLHKNNAARRKSRLMRAFNKMEPVKIESEPVVVTPVAEPESEVKKATPRRRSAKAESKAEVTTEPEAEVKKTAKRKAPAKRTTTKKPAAKKE